jgi:hypothetical protein
MLAPAKTEYAKLKQLAILGRDFASGFLLDQPARTYIQKLVE